MAPKLLFLIEAKRGTTTTEQCLPQVPGEMIGIIFGRHSANMLNHVGSYEVCDPPFLLVPPTLTVQGIRFASVWCHGLRCERNIYRGISSISHQRLRASKSDSHDV